MFPSSFGANLLVFYHERRSLISCASQQYALVNKLAAASLHFRSVCEEGCCLRFEPVVDLYYS